MRTMIAARPLPIEIAGPGPVPAEAVELVAELLLDAVDSQGARLADAAGDGDGQEETP